jgi:hypothetical protein
VLVATGVAAIVDRVIESRRDHSAAPEGTPRVEGRLPVALWPSDGTEPMVGRGIRGWREMLAALYHRDTVVDDAARARAVVIAEYPRRQQDARRELALEAHVLLGAYEPALVAAAWLRPLTSVRLDDLAAFGLSDAALATLRAAARLDEDPELVTAWRRELGIDNLRPEITPAIIAETDSDRLGMLWAVLLELAADRVAAR